MSAQATRGRSGITHCGSWTANMPPDLWCARLVCRREPGHEGRHRSWNGYEWWRGEQPRQAREAGNPGGGA